MTYDIITTAATATITTTATTAAIATTAATATTVAIATTDAIATTSGGGGSSGGSGSGSGGGGSGSGSGSGSGGGGCDGVVVVEIAQLLCCSKLRGYCNVRGYCQQTPRTLHLRWICRPVFTKMEHGRLMLHFSKNRPANPAEMQCPRSLLAISADIAISA